MYSTVPFVMRRLTTCQKLFKRWPMIRPCQNDITIMPLPENRRIIETAMSDPI